MQGTHGHDHRQGGAVRVRDDPLGPVRDLFRVDLRHHERHVGIHPERARVVDGDRAAADRSRGPDRRDLIGHVEHRHVDAVEGVLAQRDHLGHAAPDHQPPPSRPRRGDQPDLAPDVRPGRQQVKHHRADRAGGADDGQRRPVPNTPRSPDHPPVPPYTTASTWSESSSKALCVTVTARSTSSWSTTTEILISDVEIISMFTPASASVLKNRPVCPKPRRPSRSPRTSWPRPRPRRKTRKRRPRRPRPKPRRRNSRWSTPKRKWDRKSTRLNSSHLGISYAVFCLK